jgi:valacyclovir hydrolase
MPYAHLQTGARLYYEEYGRGEPIILIHGRLSTPQIDFARIIGWLQNQYRLIGIQLRGYGKSAPKPRNFPLNFYHRDADDVLAFMDAINLNKAHIMGFSDGGEVALICAGKKPERFYSVVAWGAVGYFGPEMRPYVQRSYPATWITEDDKATHGISDPNAFALEWIQATKQMIDSGGDVSLSLAPNITAPLLLMLGDKDTLNPEAYGRRFVEQTPRGRLEMFHSGHAIQDEDWDNFQRVVGAFLDSLQ